MNDGELRGIAAQAFNMAKRDMERGYFNCFIGNFYEGDGLHRMRKVERDIIARCGEDWLNSGAAKNAAFYILRLGVKTSPNPPHAMVIVTVINLFIATKKLADMPAEFQKQLYDANYDRKHEAVKEGYLAICDALHCVAQSPQRVCMYTRKLHAPPEEEPQVHFFDQAEFDGRMKLYGDEGKFTARNPFQ